MNKRQRNDRRPPKAPGFCDIRFKNGMLADLRSRLLSDLQTERFAVLLGKTYQVKDLTVVTVHEVLYPTGDDIDSQSLVSVKIGKMFVAETLERIKGRLDLDTYLEVHTHPFVSGSVAFSGADDMDEKRFTDYLAEKWPEIKYGSIVLSQTMYEARFWLCGKRVFIPAGLKTQLLYEKIGKKAETRDIAPDLADIYNRGILALGVDTMKQIMSNQTVAVVGVGGLGSIIAENLIHMGFQHLILIDNDTLELSNLNRIAGASYNDAVNHAYKADAAAKHLRAINPKCEVKPLVASIHDKDAEEAIAAADWIIACTDNHSSRFRVQEYAFKYYVPFITAGVNITVENEAVSDVSGEVITVRMGDSYCLSCLNRINFDAVASEIHPDQQVRDGLVRRGYVKGMDMKEPAVKTLNSIIAGLTVDSLVNQYTQRQRTIPVLVYENNESPCVYEDKESVEFRRHDCNICA